MNIPPLVMETMSVTLSMESIQGNQLEHRMRLTASIRKPTARQVSWDISVFWYLKAAVKFLPGG